MSLTSPGSATNCLQNCKIATMLKTYLFVAFFATIAVSFTQRRHCRIRNGLTQVWMRDRPPEESFNVRFNLVCKGFVPESVLKYIDVNRNPEISDGDFLATISSPPGLPGIPKPVWMVLLASLPSSFLWYFYYRFCVEEELAAYDLQRGRTPRGFGGYGSIAPFLCGPIAELFHVPGGVNWSTAGIIFLYYTQLLLYDRVNQLYKEEGLEEPLVVWWCWPFFFPLNIVVGLRQIHFLSEYWYRQKGTVPVRNDPVVALFPFIGAPRFTWQELFLTPALWCSLFGKVKNVDPVQLPQPVQDFLTLGDSDKIVKR